jgi:hypothetical protein
VIKIYSLFYKLLPVRKINVDAQLYLLNEAEIIAIKKRERTAIWLSAMVGGLGVLLLYIPLYLAPSWFPSMALEVLGFDFDFPVVFILYSVVLVAIEIVILSLLNIWCAHEIAVATGFLNYENKRHPEKQNLLMAIGLEKKGKELLSFGIDPLLGVNRKVLLLWNLTFILKATLTNIFFRFIIQRIMGRYLVRAVQDFAGIPIFAFWNAYGTRTILRETRVIIMGQNIIEELIAYVRSMDHLLKADPDILSDTLQYIAVSKRDFHQNHFLLTRNLFGLFGIDERKGTWDEARFIKAISNSSQEDQAFFVLLILIGLILDGRISSREKHRIKHLHEAGLIPYTEKEISGFAEDFMEGRGIEKLFKTYLPLAKT